MEGKNRVKLFRNLKQPIACIIERTPYPQPCELKLHKVIGKSDIYFISCSNSYFTDESDVSSIQVGYPEYILPLLKKYGVSFGKSISRPNAKNKDNDIFNALSIQLLCY